MDLSIIRVLEMRKKLSLLEQNSKTLKAQLLENWRVQRFYENSIRKQNQKKAGIKTINYKKCAWVNFLDKRWDIALSINFNREFKDKDTIKKIFFTCIKRLNHSLTSKTHDANAIMFVACLEKTKNENDHVHAVLKGKLISNFSEDELFNFQCLLEAIVKNIIPSATLVVETYRDLGWITYILKEQDGNFKDIAFGSKGLFFDSGIGELTLPNSD